MAKLVGFSPEDAKRIAEVVKAFEQRLQSLETQPTRRRAADTRGCITGLLTSTLARGGTATLSVWLPDAAGGLDEATNEAYAIVDAGMLAAADSPLPTGIVATAIWCDGVWMLIAYDCDQEDVS